MDNNHKSLLVERLENKVLKITFNTPDTFNAMNGAMIEELSGVLFKTARDKSVNAVVLTGAGKAFSAGGDINNLVNRTSSLGAHDFMDFLNEGLDVIKSILQMPQPVISMVNGPAIGLGATIALYSDMIIAAEKAKFADPHVKMGIVAGDGGSVIWPLLIGPAKAKEYLLTGKILEAKEAEQIGLINDAVPADELENRTLELANELAKGSQPAIQLTKRAINLYIEQFSNSLVTTSLAFEGMSFQSEDIKEAVLAFKEKRDPEFK